ncbi:MAG: PilZ domain-containing protein [Oligoflexales bacterium]|nr:PilZ domain-containing protein [Oligoflexales bacterium]
MKRENRRGGRIILQHPLKVVMCSIGAQVRYEVMTRNVSHTGFFLEYENPNRFPFTMSSIMEVWLELDDSKTVFFNGKLARVVNKGDFSEQETGTGIGIHIVQIDRENEKLLEDFLSRKMAEKNKKGESVA